MSDMLGLVEHYQAALEALRSDPEDEWLEWYVGQVRKELEITWLHRAAGEPEEK